jgi:hypothetical protein
MTTSAAHMSTTGELRGAAGVLPCSTLTPGCGRSPRELARTYRADTPFKSQPTVPFAVCAVIYGFL